jgi:uncharacterized protein (TIGR03000 family)
MIDHLNAFRRLLVIAGTLAVMNAAPAEAAPPGGNYGLYPTYASPLYPAYRPSYVSPGNYPSSGINRYNSYIPGNNYAPGFDPGFANAFARTLPSSNPYPVSRTRSYVPAEVSPDNTAHLEVLVPADAELWFNDWKARSMGPVRNLQSPPLVPGRQYTYTVRARWQENGREVTRSLQVHVSARAQVRVTFLDGNGAGKPR